MPDFGIFRGFNDKLFGNKLYAGQLPTQLGLIGSESFGYLYLLDDYPNSAAAYSLRLLRSAYTGYAIKVRRASDNTEQDIGFSNNELDTTTLASFCSGTNGFVTTWYDQSGNGNNATQTTASNQPKIYDSSTGVITENGKAAVDFTTASMFFNLNAHGIATLSLFEVIATTDSQFIILNQQGVGFSYVAQSAGTNTSLSNFGSPNLYCNNVLIGATPTWGAVHAASATGSQVVRTMLPASTSAWTASKYSGFSSFEYVGKSQELIIYNSNQSSNRTGIETNINDYYAIY